MEFEIKPQSKFSLGLKELWDYRELFYFFTWRDVKVKYKQTALGILWALFQPIIMTILITLSFGKIISNNYALPLPYPVFALSGFLLWNIFSSGLSSAGNSMVNNANIIKKIYFPRLIVPISSILVSLIDFLMAFLVFIPVLLYYECSFNITALFLIPLSVLLAAISDNTWFQFLLKCNPMNAPIELLRSSISDSHLDLSSVLVSVSVSLIWFMIGVIYFRKTEGYFADLA